MKKNNMKFVKGGFIGAVLGIAAGIALAPESGKKLRGDIKKKYAEFNAYLAPRFKKMKVVGEGEYVSFVKDVMKNYVKSKKLSEEDGKELLLRAKKSWKHIKKHSI